MYNRGWMDREVNREAVKYSQILMDSCECVLFIIHMHTSHIHMFSMFFPALAKPWGEAFQAWSSQARTGALAVQSAFRKELNPLAKKQQSTLMHFVDFWESLYGLTSILACSVTDFLECRGMGVPWCNGKISRLFGGDVQHRKQEAEFRKRLGKPGAVRVKGCERMWNACKCARMSLLRPWMVNQNFQRVNNWIEQIGQFDIALKRLAGCTVARLFFALPETHDAGLQGHSMIPPYDTKIDRNGWN